MTRNTCHGCGATIFWKRTKNGRWTPTDPNGELHWATCAAGPAFRKALQRALTRRPPRTNRPLDGQRPLPIEDVR